jgi:CheY-like chemotaxis protein
MFDHEDLKWLATTSTELNAALQQIARYCDLARQHKGQYNYIDLLGERVCAASKNSQALFDRVTSRILGDPPRDAATERSTTESSFSVVQESSAISDWIRAQLEASTASPNELSSSTKTSPPAPKEPKILNPQGTRETILFVDDEAEIAALASTMLTDEGYRVIIAHDGFEALQIYEKMGKEIGLVILDFFLPVMDGDAVFDELRDLDPGITVVLSSGFAEQSKIGAMLAQGLSGFIPKPYTREKLLEQVRSTLDAATPALAK